MAFEQIFDHRFPVRDSDPGAVERAHAIHSKTSGHDQRGAAEAFGDTYPVIDDDNVGEEIATGNVGGLAKEAGPALGAVGGVAGGVVGGIVGGPVGALAGAAGGSMLGSAVGEGAGEVVSQAASAGKGDDSVAGSFKQGASAGEKLAQGKVAGVTDATEQEMGSTGAGGGAGTGSLTWSRGGEVSAHPVIPTPPEPPAAPGTAPALRPNNQSWNMSKIADYKIGG
jgi:hypothetical protein